MISRNTSKNDPVGLETLTAVEVKFLRMDVTEIYQSTTTDIVGTSTTAEPDDALDTMSTLSSKLSELITESSIDHATTGHSSIFQSELRFSAVDYTLFGIMLAMSGER